MGLTAAAFSTVVALFSHVAAGGAMPGALGIIGPLVFSTLACTLFAGIRLSVLRLSVSVAVSQSLFHSMFILGAPTAPGALAQPGHGAHLPPVTTADAGAMLTGQTAWADGWMWLAHLIAAVVTIAALHHGEAVVRQLASFRKFVVSGLIPTISVDVAAPLRLGDLNAFSRDAVPALLGVFPSALSRRGPPEVFSH